MNAVLNFLLLNSTWVLTVFEKQDVYCQVCELLCVAAGCFHHYGLLDFWLRMCEMSYEQGGLGLGTKWLKQHSWHSRHLLSTFSCPRPHCQPAASAVPRELGFIITVSCCHGYFWCWGAWRRLDSVSPLRSFRLSRQQWSHCGDRPISNLNQKIKRCSGGPFPLSRSPVLSSKSF